MVLYAHFTSYASVNNHHNQKYVSVQLERPLNFGPNIDCIWQEELVIVDECLS